MHPDRKDFLLTLTAELARSKLDIGSFPVATTLSNILSILQHDGPLGEYYNGIVSGCQNAREGLLRDNIIEAVIKDPAFKIAHDRKHSPLRETFRDHVQNARFELVDAAETAVGNGDDQIAADLYDKAGYLTWKYLMR